MATSKKKEIDFAWKSWEHLLYSRLESFDHFLETVQSDLAAAGMGYDVSGHFLTERIVEMNTHIQSKKSGVQRGRKKVV